MAELRSSGDPPSARVITGMRGSGKSTLMSMYMDELIASGVPASDIMHINLDSYSDVAPKDHRELTDLVKRASPRKHYFFDDIQKVNGWEMSVASIHADGGDVCLTGTGPILSPELAARIADRCIENRVLPLSFSEYRMFRASGGKSDKEILVDFMHNGSLPAVAKMEDGPDKSMIPEILEGTFSTAMVEGVFMRHSPRNSAALIDVIRLMMRGIGGRISSRSISKRIAGQGLRLSHVTAEEYMAYITEAMLMSRAGRMDSSTRGYLRTSDKFYTSDTGIRNFIAGARSDDIDGILENVVYNELVYRYGNASVCDVNGLEVDFVSEADGRLMYFQVSVSIGDAGTRERELRPLRALRDGYPKTVIVYEGFPQKDIDGIRIVGILEWLTGCG